MDKTILADDKYFINASIELLEKKIQQGAKDKWTNANYVDLAFEITKVSKISISAITLKRLFGKIKTADEYEPQQATKEAIAIYLGFTSWKQFRMSVLPNMEESSPMMNRSESSVDEIKINPHFHHRRNLFVGFLLLIILALIIFFSVKDEKVFSFKGRYLIGKAYHTAVFQYRIPRHEKYEIDFGNGIKSLLNASDTIISAYYQLPGIYHVQLICEDKIVKTEKVIIETHGWEGFTHNLVSPHLIRYAPLSLHGNLLETEINAVAKAGIDTTKIFWTHFCKVQKEGTINDDFDFVCEIKNKIQIMDVRCNHIRIEIIGTKFPMVLYFTKQGCANWNKLQFSEKIMDGNKADLTAFSRDFSDWKNVRLTVKDKHVKVWYENEVIYTTKFNEPLGTIIGIHISFSGIGAARNVRINGNMIL